MFHQLNFRVNFGEADYSNLQFPEKDKAILRDLGKRVAELAALPVMAERKQLWIDHNSLKRTRPPILCDPENGWNEIITADQILCENSVARYWENHLRKQIYWGEVMNDDYVVEPVFNLPYVYTKTQWGVRGTEDRQSILKTAEAGKAYHIEKVLEDYENLENVVKPQIDIDYKATAALLETARELFAPVLDVRINTVWFWSIGLTDDLVFMRGLGDLMYDFYGDPDGLHRIMRLLSDGTMEMLDFLERDGLLCLNSDGSYVGSGGIGFTNELPASDFAGKVRLKDMWGLGESQVTSGISPEMFGEFIFPYQKPIMERFGLTCYACCEPMDKRFDIVKSVENLRRISVSPWTDAKVMAEKLGHSYVYSYKSSPTPLSMPVLDQVAARKDMKEILQITRNNRVELIMKDNHTLGGNPENLLNWVRIAREEIDAM